MGLLCDLCRSNVRQPSLRILPEKPLYWREVEVRNGKAKRLGSAEIRVFGADGSVYAAPTLLYHYVSVHHYKPPDEFMRAMKEGPRPPVPEYFHELDRLGLKWNTYALPKSIMIQLKDLLEAQSRLKDVTVRTKLVEFQLCAEDPRRLLLKPENHQPIGAFKLRGAYNKIASLSEKERQRGVISYSSGNHAQGVA